MYSLKGISLFKISLPYVAQYTNYFYSIEFGIIYITLEIIILENIIKGVPEL